MEKAIESDITNRNITGHHHDEHEIAIPAAPIEEAHEEVSKSTGEDGEHKHHEAKTN